jgi:Helix-turn-helix domain
MRRLRCLFRHHLWQPDSNRASRYVCSRCGAHVSAITDAQRKFEEPGGGAGGHLGGGPQVAASTSVVVAMVAPECRRRKQLSLHQLSDRLAAVGRPILPSGLSKIEQGTRRVVVDDLVALADALGTVPGALLQGPSANLWA